MILVTGAAGFIGFHVAQALLARGECVVGVDNLNDYYDVSLKEARLAHLIPHTNFTFIKANIAERQALEGLGSFPKVVHLAAQAGVRYSLQNPHVYAQSNLIGHLNILELCRHTKGFVHLVYASSSSVYGGNTKIPFSVEDRVDSPLSLYAATKRAGELMSAAYAHLYHFPQTGLRFFTVYGPWGRPDMAPFIFARAICAGQPLQLFNGGDMRRDFTYIDDIVAGVLAALDNPSTGHRVFNVGNNESQALRDFLTALEDALGCKASVELSPMQAGDVKETYADITATTQALGWRPTTAMAIGVPRFVAWYREYYGV